MEQEHEEELERQTQEVSLLVRIHIQASLPSCMQPDEDYCDLVYVL